MLIRAIVGWHLVYGTQDNVFSYARMLEFRDFLARHDFPFPLACAFLSAYAQFICGILFIFGLFTRPAAFVMVINFTVAIAIVHRGQPYASNDRALFMLFGAAFLFIHGAGKPSVDAMLRRR